MIPSHFRIDLNYQAYFTKIFDALSSNVNSIGSIVTGIVGIGALFYFISKTYSALANNEPIEVYPLLKPFVIMLVCINFYGVVVEPMHWILSPLRTYTNQLARKAQDDSGNLVQMIIQKAKSDREQHQRQADEAKVKPKWHDVSAQIASVVDKSMQTLGNWIYNVKMWLLSFILSVLSALREIAVFIMQFIRIFAMVVLNMIGPIAFALSVFPSFQNSISNWFAKYISIYLWLPIANILSVLISKAESLMITNMFSVTMDLNSIVMVLMLVTFYLIGIFATLYIPQMASWAVQGGETGGGLSSIITGAMAYMGSHTGSYAGAIARTGRGYYDLAKDKAKTGFQRFKSSKNNNNNQNDNE